MPANLTPVFQACTPRPPELTSSSYAADLHRAIPLKDTPNDAIERIMDAAEEHRACMTEASARNIEATEAQEQDHQDA